MNFCRGGTACRHSAPLKSCALLYAPFQWSDMVVVKNSTRRNSHRRRNSLTQ